MVVRKDKINEKFCSRKKRSTLAPPLMIDSRKLKTIMELLKRLKVILSSVLTKTKMDPPSFLGSLLISPVRGTFLQREPEEL